MSAILNPAAPVVIGGLGGSGTRVLARILIALGFFLGDDLNESYDNRLFTMLFKRPRWFMRSLQRNEKTVYTYLDILTKAMTHTSRPSWDEIFYLLLANGERVFTTYETNGVGPIVTSILRSWKTIFFHKMDLSGYVGWGWKEPNSHIYLSYLVSYYDHMKYIHVIRNGLDMAFSRNQQQAVNWGRLFNISVSRAVKCRPSAYLKYWIKANQRAIEIGERMGKEHFMILNFDELCTSSLAVIQKLITFLGLDVDDKTINRLSQLPRLPKSSGRFRKHDLSVFDPEDLEIVKKLG